jgi:DNA polymerase-3 subunit beta
VENLLKRSWKEGFDRGKVWKSAECCGKSPMFSTSFPQARSDSDRDSACDPQLFPHFPQALLLSLLSLKIFPNSFQDEACSPSLNQAATVLRWRSDPVEDRLKISAFLRVPQFTHPQPCWLSSFQFTLMKLICPQSDLNAHLSLVSRAVPSNPSHPVLANVLMNADEEKQEISLTGFDLSLGVQTSFSAQVEEGGLLTLPAKLLSDIVSRLPNEEITLSTEADSSLATLTSALGRYQVQGLDATEYPELPTVETGEAVYLPVEQIIDGLRGALFAASTDETKQVLTGVHVAVAANEMEFAATDGHRLSVVNTVKSEAADSETEAAFDVTVPGKALRELERMLQLHPAGEAIALRFDQRQLVFQWDNQRLTSRLLEGQYPNYRQLIPRQFSRQMTVERKGLIGALERISVLADKKNNIVKFSLDAAGQGVVISVDAPDVGSGRESLPAQISGDSLDIAFNVRYLLEGLKALTTSEVQMQCNTATSPAILTPLGGLKMTYLVMPIQIRS